MKRSQILSLISITIILFLISASCRLGSSSAVVEESSPSGEEAATAPTAQPKATTENLEPQEPTEPPPMEAPSPTDPPEPESAPPQEEPASCTDEVCLEKGTFLLERPIGSTGRNTIDPSYRYGDYRQSTLDTHRGVDFLNSTGTPVLAVADGEVVLAGDDLEVPYGPRRDFYGNLVILEHDLPGYPEPVYSLYGQLSEVLVEAGDSVSVGEEIGLVGMTGAVPGSTLHFEARVGENSYLAARNPELWLVLLSDGSDQSLGALAGRVLDDKGNYIQVENIVVEQLAGPGLPAIDQFYLRTYEKKELMGMSPWNESFALGGLPAGEYQITFMLNGVQQRVIEVMPGQLTLVTFQIE